MIGSHPSGKFEDFKALGALLELNICYCKKIDCKNAPEVLPIMPWAGQIKKLDLSYTDAEGTKNIRSFCGPVRILGGMFLTFRAACNTNTPRTNRQHSGAREVPERHQRELRGLQDRG